MLALMFEKRFDPGFDTTMTIADTQGSDGGSANAC